MFSWRLKVMVALSALALLAAAGGGVGPGGRAEPGLTRSNSVLPPPNTCSMQTSPKPRRVPFLGTARIGRRRRPLRMRRMRGFR